MALIYFHTLDFGVWFMVKSVFLFLFFSNLALGSSEQTGHLSFSFPTQASSSVAGGGAAASVDSDLISFTSKFRRKLDEFHGFVFNFFLEQSIKELLLYALEQDTSAYIASGGKRLKVSYLGEMRRVVSSYPGEEKFYDVFRDFLMERYKLSQISEEMQEEWGIDDPFCLGEGLPLEQISVLLLSDEVDKKACREIAIKNETDLFLTFIQCNNDWRGTVLGSLEGDPGVKKFNLTYRHKIEVPTGGLSLEGVGCSYWFLALGPRCQTFLRLEKNQLDREVTLFSEAFEDNPEKLKLFLKNQDEEIIWCSENDNFYIKKSTGAIIQKKSRQKKRVPYSQRGSNPQRIVFLE